MNAFNELLSRQQVLYNGPKATYNAEPALQGYFFTIFSLPEEILSHLSESGPTIYLNTADTQKVFAAAAKNIEINNVADVQTTPKPGIGGTKIHIPTQLTTPDTMTIGFHEYYGYVIMKLIYKWVSKIIDPATGLSNLSKFKQSNYKATVDIALFEPAGSEVTAAFRCYGVYPTTTPTSLGMDIASNGLVEHSVTFSVDRILQLDCLEESLTGILSAEVEKIRSSNGSC